MDNEKLGNDEKSTEDSLKFLAKSSVFIFIGIMLSKILSYIFRMAIARYIGSEVYGLFTLSTSIIECFSIVFTLGLINGVVRYVSFYRGTKEQGNINYIVKITLITVSISCLIGGLIFLLASKYLAITIFHNPKLLIFLYSFSIVVPLSVMGMIFLSIIQAYEDMKWYTFIRNFMFNLVELIVIVLGILFYYFYFKESSIYIYTIIFSYILGSFSILISAIIYCRIKLRIIFKKIPIERMKKSILKKELFNYSWPLMFVGLLYMIYVWIDTFILGIFKDVVSVGIYNVAIPIAMLLVIVPQLFTYLFFPMITKEYAKNNHVLIRNISNQIGKWIFLLNLPIFMIIMLFPGTIINILFGPNYFLAIWPLRFLSIGIMFYSILVISDNLLSMKGKSKIILFNLIVSALINLTLNIILVPIPSLFGLDNTKGLVGASIATMITYIIWSSLTIYFAKKYSGIMPLRKNFILIALISLIPSLLIFYIRKLFVINIISLMFFGLLFVAIYMFLLFITKCFDSNDYMIIKTLIKRLKTRNFK